MKTGREAPNELNKLKKNNQYLLYGLIGLVVLNLIFLFVF